MADSKADPRAAAKPVAPTTVPAPSLTPEAAAQVRIDELQAKVTALEQEVRILRGKATNRDPAKAQALTKENAALRERVKALENALAGLLQEAAKPKYAEAATIEYSVLSQNAVEYFKKINLDPELWKNIAS